MNTHRPFVDVDRLIAETPLEAVIDRYQLPPSDPQGREYRLDCVFNETCRDSEYGQLTVSQTDPAKRIFCHTCRVKGNLLTLIHGLETGQPPAGGRLRSGEFTAALTALKSLSTGESAADKAAHRKAPSQHESDGSAPVEANFESLHNVPLRRHEKEAARKLENLYEDLIVDPDEMSPEAAAYFRSRPWLTPEVARRWGAGYLPRDGRSLFRGYVVSTHRNERNDVLSYSGRDVQYEEKLRKWERAGRSENRPSKHRYVSGYHRGLELYGQSKLRLEEERIGKSLASIGLIVVEGANDVIRLDTLNAAAVGLCSNRATEEQVDKIARFARTAAGNRVVLMPDCDAEGETGFQELLWKLNERQLSVSLAWSRTMFEGQFDGRQPEDLTDEKWHEVLLPSLQGLTGSQ